MARQYERYRPTYPDALLDDLATLRPARVLDVGCGTGKAAVGLAGRGLSVLGVELDLRMAVVACGHGVPVEVGAFETWDDAGRRFDLITCGAAWQWIDPELGMAKAANSALNPSVSPLSRERCTRRSKHSAAPSTRTAEPTSCWPAALSLALYPARRCRFRGAGVVAEGRLTGGTVRRRWWSRPGRARGRSSRPDRAVAGPIPGARVRGATGRCGSSA